MHSIWNAYTVHLEHLRLFSAIARSKSLSEGARQVGCSQSAASQAIAQLEQHLRTPLLDRSRRPLALTSAGQRLQAGIGPLLHSWDRLVAELQPSAEISGTVTVAAIHSLGIHLLVGLVQRFSAEHPAVRVRTQHLRQDEVVQAVRERRVDLGILSYPPTLRGIEVIHLRDEPLVVICHPAHRLVPRRRLQLRDLQGQRFVAFDRDLPIRKAIDEVLRQAGVQVEPVMELDNVESMKQAVQSGCGLAILPEPTVLREAMGRLLVALPIEDISLTRPIAAIKQRAFHDPAADAFIAFVHGSMHQQSANPVSAPIAPVRYGRTPSQYE
jgi:DNA-binding transcriptional LysR family regulator